MAFPNFTDIAASAIESRSRIVADNVTKNAALLVRLRTKGKMKYFTGGTQIFQEFAFQENANFMWYSGNDLLQVNAQDVISGATFQIKQAACAVTITGLEEIQNSGKERMLNLMDERLEVAENTMANNMSAGIFSDGTGFGGKQLTGLGVGVVANPTTGVYGGVDPSTSVGTFWRNQFTGSLGAQTPATIQPNMNALWVKCVRNKNKPDLIVSDNTLYGVYWNSLQALQRFTGDSDVAKLGFSTLKYATADFVLDGGFGGFATANALYYLNTDFIFLRPFEARDFKPLAPNRRVAINQDASVAIIAWAGNLTMNARFAHGFFQAS